MPDWSYRTVLRAPLLAYGAERSRRLAVGVLSTLGSSSAGRSAIDFLGHMRADPRLLTTVGSLEVAGPIVLGALLDPEGRAAAAFARFGPGLVEIGPVGEATSVSSADWQIDLAQGFVHRDPASTVSATELATRIDRLPSEVSVCVRLAPGDAPSIARIVRTLESRATMFSISPANPEEARSLLQSLVSTRPLYVRVRANDPQAEAIARTAIEYGAAGLWIAGQLANTLPLVRTLRALDVPLIAEGVLAPEDARILREAGAALVVVDAGLVVSGPGLVKRCNEALLSTIASSEPAESLTMDAARRSWFWAVLLGIAMIGGGLLAAIIASTRVVLPYDESMAGMTRAQLAALNPRLLPFMTHDRVSLAGTMISIGIFYAALGWFGIRRGAHWARATVIASATVGFLTFFFFLGFGYFDPFHAFVTAILTQFTLLCLVLPPSPPQPGAAEWRETAAWRRGLWGQLIFVLIGIGLTGAGIVISIIGCTDVFVATDLEFMQTTAKQLHHSYETLLPLVAHDRASLGGMLIANGIAVWLIAQWGFRAGARWLWAALAVGGNIAFACGTLVHFVVGYHSLLHLTPAIVGWLGWNVALALCREWLCERAVERGS